MQRAGLILIAVLAMAMAVCAAALCGVARAESASVLLQEGVYEQDVTGNIDRAMEAYQQIIKDAATDRRYVAEAHYRLGKCLLAKGDKDKAQEEFQQVVQAYADQPGLAAAARTELAKLAPPAPGTEKPALGPVVELTVNDPSAERDFLVDLDTGRLVTPPADLAHNGKDAARTWFRSSGVDAISDTGPAIQGLFGFDMVAEPVASDLWDSVTAQTIRTRKWSSIANGGAPAPMPGKGALPATYLFKTREGGMGILQIVGFADNPKGVKIRYRMVQAAAPSAAPADVRTILVPDVDASGKGLSLDRGELVSLPNVPDQPSDAKSWMGAIAGVGADLFFAKATGSVVLVEGTTAEKMAAVTKEGNSFTLLDWAPGNIVTTRTGNRFQVLSLHAGEEGIEITFQALGSAASGAAGQPGQSARLTDLRLLLADAQAELTTKQAERDLTGKDLERAKQLAAKNALDTQSLEHAQADAAKASAEYDAARQKVDILTKEIARLEAMLKAPAPAAPRKAALTEVDISHAAFDLVSGDLVPLPPPDSTDKELAAALGNLRKGDVVYGHPEKGANMLAFMRGASPDVPDGVLHEAVGGPIPFKALSGSLPMTFTVRAADGKPYTVTVLRADDQSCDFEYSPVTAAPLPQAATQVAVPALPKKVTLLDVDKSQSPPAALDLASGELVVLPKEKSATALVNLGKGDVVFTIADKGVPILAFLRGASPDAPDGTAPDRIAGPTPYKIVFGPWPTTFTVRAADGKSYSITVLHADEQGCELEYSPAAAPPANPSAPGKAIP